MIDTATLPRNDTHNVVSDAHADIQSALDILDSLRLAGKLSQDHFQDVIYFLESAQEELIRSQPRKGKGATK